MSQTSGVAGSTGTDPPQSPSSPRPLRLLRPLRPLRPLRLLTPFPRLYLTTMPGTLYTVATPLGNLGDLSARAAELLRTVPVVAAEDTRRTRGLLTHLGASPQLLSYHAHSVDRRVETLLGILDEGRDVALVCD